MSINVIETLNPLKVNVMETFITKCHQYSCQREMKIQNVIKINNVGNLERREREEVNKNKLARVMGIKSKRDFFFILTSADDGDDAGEKKVSVSENLVLEKSIGIGIATFGTEKKSWFRSKFWSRHSADREQEQAGFRFILISAELVTHCSVCL